MALKRSTRQAAKGFKTKHSKISVEILDDSDIDMSPEQETPILSSQNENSSKKFQETSNPSLSEKESTDDEVTESENFVEKEDSKGETNGNADTN